WPVESFLARSWPLREYCLREFWQPSMMAHTAASAIIKKAVCRWNRKSVAGTDHLHVGDFDGLLLVVQDAFDHDGHAGMLGGLFLVTQLIYVIIDHQNV